MLYTNAINYLNQESKYKIVFNSAIITEDVSDGIFINCDVHLKHQRDSITVNFWDCTFIDCTFVGFGEFNFSFKNCAFNGICSFIANPEYVSTAKIRQFFGCKFVNDPIVDKNVLTRMHQNSLVQLVNNYVDELNKALQPYNKLRTENYEPFGMIIESNWYLEDLEKKFISDTLPFEIYTKYEQYGDESVGLSYASYIWIKLKGIQ